MYKVNTYVGTHTYIHTPIYEGIYKYVPIYIYIYIHSYIYMYMYMCVCVCVCVHTHICICIYESVHSAYKYNRVDKVSFVNIQRYVHNSVYTCEKYFFFFK